MKSFNYFMGFYVKNLYQFINISKDFPPGVAFPNAILDFFQKKSGVRRLATMPKICPSYFWGPTLISPGAHSRVLPALHTVVHTYTQYYFAW